MALLGVVLVPDTLVAVAPGSVSGHVTIKRGRRDKKDRSNVLILVRGVPDSRPEPLAEPTVVDQTDKTFNPRLTVVPVGSTVDFPNNDRVFHNVFSVSRPATFDLGLYKSGTSKSVTFEQPGVVDVYCNIHPEMAAKVVVVDTEHYVVTGPDGAFTLDGIPPGTYTLVAWQAHGERYEGWVEVGAGKTTTLDIELREERWPHDRHTRKDGTPYGRYK
ncbi:carboxypeptidase regulatory-like domain-containing protein [Paraliomyxa miuraensis]|uniref:carboxypeptidase regulatory-like domain-containing protein n=1 Tax=Paraliomyxa miuraensis TaxID=376150 RepID=UPI00225A6BCA|nr:carboxypeptidase regulatory-like domain-containing protein [Paraliomyxa miuraensis]MCX4239329.1 carboxypeptidase regulatory-like domain-containing protein [Paraliomyxa miuraensis]